VNPGRKQPLDFTRGAPSLSRTSAFHPDGGMLDTAEIRWHSSPMTIILILALALVAGVMIQSRWALLLPVASGACVAVAIAATGHGLTDTPILFLVVVSTLVMVGGQGLRSRGRGNLVGRVD
jgi:hypothetical protein